MSTPIIQCNNLSHSYAGKIALDNISFELDSSEPVGLVGPNGAGKSTLLSILCGFIRPNSGSVSLFGQNPGVATLNTQVSALPQDARLDPSFTIGEQLHFFARLQGLNKQQGNSETARVLEAVGLKDLMKEKPATLSHGMAKRVSIAQALIGNPKLILLDEPTAGLDPINTRKIRNIIAELTPSTTFIISSHDLNELGRLCQKILLLENGKMSSTQLTTTDQDKPTQFFTLQMAACPAPEVIKELQQLVGVLQVSNPQKDEFIVEYNPIIESQIDIKILHCLIKNNWQYRQFSQGKTLEEKLFFDSTN